MSTTNVTTDISTLIAVAKLGTGTGQATKKKEKRGFRSPETREAVRERLRKQGWQKGQSGNPKGRPPNPLSLTAILNRKLRDRPEDAEAIVGALIMLAKKTNISQLAAIDRVFDRIDGKVAERHEFPGELPFTLLFRPARELLEEGKQRERKQIVEGEGRNEV